MADITVTVSDAAGNRATRVVTLPVESTAPASRANNCSVWAMMWPNSPKTDLVNLPTAVDEVRLAFAVNNGKLAGYGPYGGKDNLVAALKAFLAKRTGRFISLSVGGGGYTIDVSNPAAFVTNIQAIEDNLGITFGGLNWDWESNDFAPGAANAIKISRSMKSLRGNGFYVSWSPNGVYKEAYRNALKGAPDVVDEIAQQFYDAPVTYDQALSEVRKYVALFGADRVGTGCAMAGSSGTGAAWNLATWLTNITRLRADTGIRKTNFWEGHNSAVAQWAPGVKAVTS